MNPVWLCSPLPPPYDLTLITHTKPKPKDEESYRKWSPNPVPDPRLRRSDRAASNPSPMNLVWSCSPSHPPCNLASRSNLVASTTRSRRLSLFLLLSIWPDLMNFFFLGFVSFVFLYWGMILYICLEAEKMWATSRKYVFYGIFKNTTKHQKIFFKTFFEMQPNTWKYFTPGKYFTLKQMQPKSLSLHFLY